MIKHIAVYHENNTRTNFIVGCEEMAHQLFGYLEHAFPMDDLRMMTVERDEADYIREVRGEKEMARVDAAMRDFFQVRD